MQRKWDRAVAMTLVCIMVIIPVGVLCEGSKPILNVFNFPEQTSAPELPATVLNPTLVRVTLGTSIKQKYAINVWCDEQLIFSEYRMGKLIDIAVVPGTMLKVMVTTDNETREATVQVPAAEPFKGFGYKRVESYTAYVKDGTKDFYSQKRKSLRAISEDELYKNIKIGYDYRFHLNFDVKKSNERKVFDGIVLVMRGPNNLLYAGKVPANIVIMPNGQNYSSGISLHEALEWLRAQPNYTVGKYMFELYSNGLYLASTSLQIDP